MNSAPLISWNAPAHYYVDKHADWYWAVGVITFSLAAVAFIFGQVITGIFVVVAAVALVLHASRPPQNVLYSINDRGIVADDILYTFLELESFWIPHDQVPHTLILKSRKLFMPFIIIYIDEVDPEKVREIMLTYIAETEHREPLLKHLLERLGF